MGHPEGWNMVAFDFAASEASGDRVVSLKEGWNLVGYSASSSGKQAIVNPEGTVQQMAAFYDSHKGSYQLKALKSGDFEPGQGYWIYSNSKKPVQMTFEDTGGSAAGRSMAVDELTFRNQATGELTKGLPLQVFILKWNSEKGLFEHVKKTVNSWEGYFVYSPTNAYSLVG